MKKLVLTIISAASFASVIAQDQYSAENIATSDLNGTARYVSLGGALDALGGDISVMGSNPAGIAIYKRADVAVTGSVLVTGESGQLGKESSRISFDQAGAVFTLGQDQPGSGLKYVNFGINYQKRKNFFANADINIDHLNDTYSQSLQAAGLAQKSLSENYFGLFTDVMANSGALAYDETNKTFSGSPAETANYKRNTRGAINQADFNVSFNISDQLFLGATIGVYNVDYKRDSYYTETGIDHFTYDVENWYDINGNGFDVKLGAIVRPFKNSPFRFGVSVHTPTWYSLEDCNGTTVFADNTDRPYGRQADPYEYNYRTPWKFGFSLGHTFGKVVALGAQYEISDLSTTHYRSKDWENDAYFDVLNDKVNDQLKTQHTLRVGLEIKPISSFALRFGYNYVSSPIESNAWKETYYDGYNGETDFTNWKGTNRFTCGLGYRFKDGYFDLAYQYQSQKGDFYAFDDEALIPTKINNNRSQILATLGFRF